MLYGKKCCTLCYFILNFLSLPPLQYTIPGWTKQQAQAAPPYNNELGNCLLKRVTSHVKVTDAGWGWSEWLLIFKQDAIPGCQSLRWRDSILTLLQVQLSVSVYNLRNSTGFTKGKQLSSSQMDRNSYFTESETWWKWHLLSSGNIKNCLLFFIPQDLFVI